MKKLSIMLALIIGLFAAAPATVYAQELSKAQTKAIEKDAKKRCKELKKAGWEPLASTSTMEYSMLKYRTYLEQDDENRIAITGIATGKNNKIGRENAIHSGVASYAQRAKAQIVGKVKSVISSDANNTSQEEIDKFGAAYESGVNAKIGGLVKEHFALVRTNPTARRSSTCSCRSTRPAHARPARTPPAPPWSRLRCRISPKWLKISSANL